MKFLPRLTMLSVVGMIALLLAAGAAGARARGQAQAAVPAPATTAQDQPGPTRAVPLAVPAAAPPAPGAQLPSGGGGSTLPGLPGGGASGGDPPALAAKPDQPEGAEGAAASPGGPVTLTADPPIIRQPTDTATITAVVTDAAGSPLAGVLVTFSLDDAEAGQLGTVQARTDAAGVATTTFTPEIFRGAATVSAATAEGPVARVTIRISCGC